VRVYSGAEVVRAERSGGGFTLRTADGAAHKVDQLVLATNAAEARALTANLPGAMALSCAMAPVSYFKTTIAVHGDRRLMPADRRHWGSSTSATTAATARARSGDLRRARGRCSEAG
jgi:predicted NAD/FAD-binding protein